MKSIVDKLKRFNLDDYAFSAALVLIGILLVLFSDTALRIAVILVGGLLLAFSLYRFLLLFTTHSRSLWFYLLFGVNAALLIFSLTLIFRSDATLAFLGTLCGLYLILSGVIKLCTLLSQVDRVPRFWISVTLSSLSVVFGLFVACFPRAIAGFLAVLIGIALLYEGISDIVLTAIEHSQSTSADFIEPDYEDKTK